MEDISQVYADNAQMVYRYLYSLCHNEDWAQEMTQETFFRAVEKIDSYDNDGYSKITTWLCQIAKYVWCQELNKKMKMATIELDQEAYLIENHNLEELLIEKETKIEIFKIIQGLSEPNKSVMQLRISGDLTFAEIGEILGKSENWARVTYYRTKEKVAEKLKIMEEINDGIKK